MRRLLIRLWDRIRFKKTMIGADFGQSGEPEVVVTVSLDRHGRYHVRDVWQRNT